MRIDRKIIPKGYRRLRKGEMIEGKYLVYRSRRNNPNLLVSIFESTISDWVGERLINENCPIFVKKNQI